MFEGNTPGASGPNYRSNIVRRTVILGPVNTPFQIPLNGDFFRLISSTGTITVRATGDLTNFQPETLASYKFNQPFGQNMLSIESTGANDVVSFEVGFGLVISPASLTIGGIINVAGQFAEGTAITTPNDATLFPFVGGTRAWNLGPAIRALESVNPTQFIASTSRVIAPLLVVPTRNDLFSNVAIAVNTSSGQDIQSDHAMVTVTLTGTAADVLDTLGQISDSANATPTVYNLQTGLPTAVSGRMVVPGQYFFFIEGFSRITFSAPVTNAAAVNTWASASAACRPALIPVALRDEAGAAYADANPLQVTNIVAGASVSSSNGLPVTPTKLRTYSSYFQSGGNYNGFIFDLPAAVGVTVKLKRVEFNSIASALGHNEIYLAKYSTAATGGTSAAMAAVPHISTDAAAVAAPLKYTAVQATTGTLVGIVRLAIATQVLIGTTLLAPPIISWFFGDKNDKEFALVAGSAEHLALLCNGPVGFQCDGYIEWTEE